MFLRNSAFGLKMICLLLILTKISLLDVEDKIELTLWRVEKEYGREYLQEARPLMFYFLYTCVYKSLTRQYFTKRLLEWYESIYQEKNAVVLQNS